MHSLIRRLGGNNTCQAKAMKRCKPEVEVWHDKPYTHPPIPNGCGSRDLPVRLAKHGDFKPCCDEHDICYATCGRSKSECDEAFHVCMSAHCHAEYLPRGKRRATHLQRCLGEASLYYSVSVCVCICVGSIDQAQPPTPIDKTHNPTNSIPPPKTPSREWSASDAAAISVRS